MAIQDADAPHPPRALPPGRVAGAGPLSAEQVTGQPAWSAGGIAGDAAAVARWGYLLYGGRILAPTLVARMHPLDDGTNYGLGTETFRSVLTGLDFVGHRGDFGPYRSQLAVATDRPLAIAVLLAQDNATASPSPVVEALADALLAE